MSDLFTRLVYCTDPARGTDRIFLLKELFDKLSDKKILTNDDISAIVNNTYEVLKKHKEAIQKID